MSVRLLRWLILCALQVCFVSAFATGLLDAARFNQQAAVAALIASGADVDAQGRQGDTALHWAAFNGNSEIVRALIDAGANVNDPLANGNTPLHLAAFKGHAAVVERLLSGGADPGRRNRDGETPLDLARAGGHQAAMAQLAGGSGGSRAAEPPGQPSRTAPVPVRADAVSGNAPASYRLQLVAVSSEARAQSALLDYRDRFADLLTGDRLMVDPSDGPNGTLYRVQYGPLALDKAQSLCAELRQREQSCLVRTIPDD